MQVRADPKKSALPFSNYSHILYQIFEFTQNLKRSRRNPLLDFRPVFWAYFNKEP